MDQNQDSVLQAIQATSISLSKQEIKQFLDAQLQDKAIQKLVALASEELKRRKMKISPQGILYHVEDGHELMLVPQSLRQKIMKENHDVPSIGHMGQYRTVDLIKRAFYCRGLWKDVGQYVQSCLVCQLMKSDHWKKAGLLQPIPLPKRKWQ